MGNRFTNLKDRPRHCPSFCYASLLNGWGKDAQAKERRNFFVTLKESPGLWSVQVSLFYPFLIRTTNLDPPLNSYWTSTVCNSLTTSTFPFIHKQYPNVCPKSLTHRKGRSRVETWWWLLCRVRWDVNVVIAIDLKNFFNVDRSLNHSSNLSLNKFQFHVLNRIF